MRTLSHDEARAFYDRLGARQDSQRFYEDPALDDLAAHAGFGTAHSVLEFGCGTGRFAAGLLADVLPPDCRYRALDISATMVRLARERLARWSDRVVVEQTSGSTRIKAPDGGVDRFVACYVLDLLSEEDIRDLLAEARRILVPGGLLCTVGLTHGRWGPAMIVGVVWQGLFRLSPRLVGGCRPLAVRDRLAVPDWLLRHRAVVTRFGISSEVLVAARTGD